MAKVTIEGCLKKVSDRFMLVMLASELTREINSGAKITSAAGDVGKNVSRGASQNNKNTVVALRAIADGSVNCDTLKDALLLRYRRNNAKAFAEDLLADPIEDEVNSAPSVLDVDISNEYLEDDTADEQDLDETLAFAEEDVDDIADDDVSKPKKGNEAQILDDKSQMYTDEEDVTDD